MLDLTNNNCPLLWVKIQATCILGPFRDRPMLVSLSRSYNVKKTLAFSPPSKLGQKVVESNVYTALLKYWHCRKENTHKKNWTHILRKH